MISDSRSSDSGSDLGLYGPESVTWRVHADPSMAVGGLRALLLQAVHPVVMSGFATNSGYRQDPWGRLIRTAEYVTLTTYGTTADAERAGEKIRRVHELLPPLTDPDTGETRYVNDPDLLLWVHCCEVDSFLHTARRSGLRLTSAEADRYVAEQVHAARLIGIPRGTVEVPRTVADVAAYFDEMRPELRTTRDAYDGLRFLALPPMKWWVRFATPAMPGWAGLATLSFNSLPRWARSLYTRLPATPLTDVSVSAGLRTLRAGLLAVPPSVREGPMLKAARARAASVSVRRLDLLPA
jgi:uncharacterized protein (DUF2236 family)